jgi:uncharacterized membrane protein
MFRRGHCPAGCRPADFMQAQTRAATEIESAVSHLAMTEDSPHPSLTKTVVFIAVAVITNSFGNLLLAIGMDKMPSFQGTSITHYLLALVSQPFVLPGAGLTAIYTFAQLSLFSWADLSYVIPCTAASYVMTTILSKYIMGERVDLARWMGVVLICAGVLMVAKTPTTTKEIKGKAEC